MKIKKKFYVASSTMHEGGSRNDWAHENLEDAIEHAKSLLSETKKIQYIVQIIRVVKLPERPMVVEEVE
jgi:hypothetical protein